jgi:hypothetical protein
MNKEVEVINVPFSEYRELIELKEKVKGEYADYLTNNIKGFDFFKGLRFIWGDGCDEYDPIRFIPESDNDEFVEEIKKELESSKNSYKSILDNYKTSIDNKNKELEECSETIRRLKNRNLFQRIFNTDVK